MSPEDRGGACLFKQAAGVLLLGLGVVDSALDKVCTVLWVGAQHHGAVQCVLVPLAVLHHRVLQQHAQRRLRTRPCSGRAIALLISCARRILRQSVSYGTPGRSAFLVSLAAIQLISKDAIWQGDVIP